MSWQRRARAGLAVAGLAAAVAVYLLARDRTEPERVSLEPTDANVVAEGGATTRSHISLSFETVRISASAWKEFSDGRVWYENPLAVFEDDGVEVRAAEALASGGDASGAVPGTLEMSGDVTVSTTDGLVLKTPLATYDSAVGVVTMPEHLEIQKGRMTATGTGGYYDRPQDLFRIADSAHVVVAAADDGTGAMEASATSLTMARQEQFVRLEGQARIQRPAEVLTSDIATIYFVETTEEVRLLDMRGNARVTPVEGAPNPPPAMRGDTISMTFQPETRTLQEATLTGNARLVTVEGGAERTIDAGWIQVATGADGRTLTRLAARDNVVVTLPASDGAAPRTIRAPLLNATGAEGQGLERARFEGGVEYVESPVGEPARTARSRVLTLALDGGLTAIEEAEFLERVSFVGEDLTASAERAVYRERADELDLHPGTDGSASGMPHAESRRLTIDAPRITLSLSGDAVRARGGVRTLTRPDPDSSDRPTALFAADQPVVGSADSFDYREDQGVATYRGTAEAPARLLQDGNEVAGRVIVVREESGDLTAETDVVSVFVLDAEDDSGTVVPTTYTIRATRLDYVEARRTATYRGAPVELESGEARSQADTIVLTVAAESREVEFVDWHANVYALLENRYEAKGDTLRHEVATGNYRLEGAPAVTKLPAEGRTDCVRSSGLVTIFNRRTGEASWPASLNTRGRQVNESMSCEGTIR